MNYKERIESLKQKGFFTEEQAKRLTGSFEVDEVSDRSLSSRRWYLEWIGVLLMAIAGVALWIRSSGVGQYNSTPQSVERTLNAPIDAGIGAGSTVWLIVGIVLIGGYLLFYLGVRDAYRRRWQMWEEKRKLHECLHALEVMQKELIRQLEAVRQNPSASSPKGVKVGIGDDEAMHFVMETQKSVASEILETQERIGHIGVKEAMMAHSLWGMLASLAGKLPNKEQ